MVVPSKVESISFVRINISYNEHCTFSFPVYLFLVATNEAIRSYSNTLRNVELIFLFPRYLRLLGYTVALFCLSKCYSTPWKGDLYTWKDIERKHFQVTLLKRSRTRRIDRLNVGFSSRIVCKNSLRSRSCVRELMLSCKKVIYNTNLLILGRIRYYLANWSNSSPGNWTSLHCCSVSFALGVS